MLRHLSTADQAAAGSGDLSARPKIGGHPRGLLVLFFVEMWERFSYYGMRALLILYLTQHFLFSDHAAQGIFASYASLVYLTPLLGGFLSDRYLGPRKAVLIGALFLSTGHFVMAYEGSGSRQFITSGSQRWEIVASTNDGERELFASNSRVHLPMTLSAAGAEIGGAGVAGHRRLAAGTFAIETQHDPIGEATLFLALSLIIIGVGFLKSNIATLLGALYDREDANRDSGFTIFYVGINVGSVMATSLCGWLGIVYGWRWGFSLAGLGMLIGLATFLLGSASLQGRGEPPMTLRPIRELYIWIGAVLTLGPICWLVQHDEATSAILIIVSSTAFVAIFLWSLIVYRGPVRTRMIVAIVLILFAIIFRTLMNQAGSTITLYAARLSDLRLWGDIRMTAAQTTLFNPVFIVTIAPLFAGLWILLAKRHREPSIPAKFAWGLALAGASFLLLGYGTASFPIQRPVGGGAAIAVPLFWLILYYLLQTIGEILVAPVGLSMITKLSAPRTTGLMMGMWYLASSLAYSFAGAIGKLTSTATSGGVVLDPYAQLQTYIMVFNWVGWTGIVAAAILFALTPLLKRGLAGVL